jgi:hypothetical protein
MAELGDLVKEGKIKYYEDNHKVGVEQYVHIVNDLYDGKNRGKLMMTIHEEERKVNQAINNCRSSKFLYIKHLLSATGTIINLNCLLQIFSH